MAQWNDESVVVYQAFRPDIGHFAAERGYFGGNYSFGRMTWVKPNFLWMMFRSGWGRKPDQEVTLAIWLRRSYFDQLLALAVPSTYWPHRYETRTQWQAALKASDVRLQWDPDHGPHGERLERRAIQLGVRSGMQKQLGKGGGAIEAIEDISNFVAEQRDVLGRDVTQLVTPVELPYPVDDAAVAEGLGLT